MKGKDLFLLCVILIGVVFLIAIPAQAQRQGENPTTYSGGGPGTPAVLFADNLRGSVKLADFSPVAMSVELPEGLSSGPVVVATNHGVSAPLTMTVGAPGAPDLSGIAETWGITVTGVISEDAVWSEHTLLNGVVTVAAGATLTITPGATIFGAADAELVIDGALIAEGTAGAPIYFTSSDPDAAPGAWQGIRITRHSHDFSLKYALVQYAQNAVYFRSSVEGAAYLSGIVSHSTLQYNQRGLYVFVRPDTAPYNHTVTAQITATHNYVYSNTIAGMAFRTSAGGGWANDYSLVAHNRFEENATGINIYANTWWIGHTDNSPTIRNNAIRNNLDYGISIEAYGSTDGSGSDTQMYPIIEHNLLENNPTSLRLYLNPRGTDGKQILDATVRHNTFRHSSFGIRLAHAQSYNTLTATIEGNVFYGFDEAEGYAIFNPTGRPLSADGNYWGDNEEVWAQGATGMISGTITVTHFLAAGDPPVLTHIAPGMGQAGDIVALHGANLGEMEKVFLPAVLKPE